LQLVDFPGAECLRKQLVERWLTKGRSSLRAIAFVVDSSSFSKRSRDVAEFFYDVVLESGKKVDVIRVSLEKEIGLINKTRAAALSSTDGSSASSTLTGNGDRFTWNDLPMLVLLLSCSNEAIAREGAKS
uniref:Signal recognition particle receptor subunit beta n=1 Tax=Angiostrongylus cantonensis TaxID=6313 RepID=A0A0K0DM41_ANGCA